MAQSPTDLNLPLSAVTKILKQSLPEGVTVSAEAKRAIANAASVFVLYITSNANEITHNQNRKMMKPSDCFASLNNKSFSSFVQPLKDFMDEYKKAQSDKKTESANVDEMQIEEDEPMVCESFEDAH